MSVYEQIDALLDEWEVLQETGQPMSPGDLCKDSPHLVLELSRRIEALQAIDRFLWQGKMRLSFSGEPT